MFTNPSAVITFCEPHQIPIRNINFLENLYEKFGDKHNNLNITTQAWLLKLYSEQDNNTSGVITTEISSA